ncbi:Arm DNA-binding domain-containing protein [Aurantibacter aestuarii]|uniref:Arm DNA-binding domain-containing protein n=1 Tax=Aurantibacter aestuarii TaxID=1266046 RepID=A0A2T1NEM8_9FLAO|nr:Arm DNA-binding domain-containing protein [Aurantibacter aestuarii]PSG90897.1 hypothetical protein C7H52_06385 [Aurantibacter aestuarii]
MTISYYLNSERKKNLYCRISDGKERTTFSLKHYVNPDTWDAKNEDVKWENQYSGALASLKRVLVDKYESIKNNDPKAKVELLKNEAVNYFGNDGLEGLQRNLWNNGVGSSVGFYEDFISAIEKFSGFKRNQLKISSYEYSMDFTTPEGIYYEVDTHNGHSLFLKDLVLSHTYDEIYTETWPQLWHQIYIDDGIKKSDFIPQFLHNWEQYWEHQKLNIASTSNFQKLKEESWNRFAVFMSCYNDSDPFELASKMNDIEFIPLCVITMLDIFDIDICLDEYCEYYFTNEIWDWESFDLSDGYEAKEDQLSQSIFYFREKEF